MRNLIVAFILGLGGMVFAAAATAHTTVNFWTAKVDRCRPDQLSKISSDCLIVENIHASVLRRPDLDLQLVLPGIGSVVASRVSSESIGTNGFIWRGVVKSASFSRVVFSAVNDAVIGTIAIDKRMYRLRMAKNGNYVVEELDIKRLPGHPPTRPPPPPPSPPLPLPPSPPVPEPTPSPPPPSPPLPLPPSPPVPEPTPSPPPPGEGPVRTSCYEILYRNPGDEESDDDSDCPRVHAFCDTDSPLRIDVMVLYTPAAALTAGGAEFMSAWINLQADLTNLSYIESNLAQQINLVHIKEIEFEAPPPLGTDPDAATCLDHLTQAVRAGARCGSRSAEGVQGGHRCADNS